MHKGYVQDPDQAGTEANSFYSHLFIHLPPKNATWTVCTVEYRSQFDYMCLLDLKKSEFTSLRHLRKIRIT